MKQRPPPLQRTNKQTNKQKRKKGEDKKKKKPGGPFLKKLPYYLKLSASGWMTGIIIYPSKKQWSKKLLKGLNK